IYEAEITDSGHSYLAMEYCSRPSLDMQFKQGRFSADKAMEIGLTRGTGRVVVREPLASEAFPWHQAGARQRGSRHGDQRS
ncbi:hypothetical protein, partial [Arthrobacter sp. BF1]|uniref:hypothetical protein n=1 Tax=Arthrobacter sp. BF1 TaxID=2821145 RepID=UPI001C4F2600